jgi:hypothetical protein
VRGPSPLHHIRCAFCDEYVVCRCLTARGPDHRRWCEVCEERHVEPANRDGDWRQRALELFAISDVLVHQFSSGWGLQIVSPAAEAWAKVNVTQPTWLVGSRTLLVDGRQALVLGQAMAGAGLLVRQAR